MCALGIVSLSRFGTALAARTETVLYPPALVSYLQKYLN
jgi:hypothetical protein